MCLLLSLLLSFLLCVCVCDGDTTTRDDECVYDSASSFKHMHLCYCRAGKRETTRKPEEHALKKIVSRKMENGCGW